MARGAAIATDNFNRADETLGAPNWQQLDGGGFTVVVESNTYRGSHQGGADSEAGDYAAAVWTGSGTFADNQWASAEITALSTGSNQQNVGVIVRASTQTGSARDYYFAIVGAAWQVTLGKWAGGAKTILHQATTSAWAVGDRIELEVEGTTLRLCKNGIPLGGSFTQTDSSLTSGKPGVQAQSGGAAFGSADNWQAGNMVVTQNVAGEPRSRTNTATRVDAHKAISGVARAITGRLLIPAWG